MGPDLNIAVDMYAHAMDHTTSATIILISDECHLAYAVSMLRLRKVCTIAIATLAVNSDLKRRVSRFVDWERLMAVNDAETVLDEQAIDLHAPTPAYSSAACMVPGVSAGSMRVPHSTLFPIHQSPSAIPHPNPGSEDSDRDSLGMLQRTNAELENKLVNVERTLQTTLADHESELEEMKGRLEEARVKLCDTKREEKELRSKEVGFHICSLSLNANFRANNARCR